jgi:hypothetical protein
MKFFLKRATKLCLLFALVLLPIAACGPAATTTESNQPDYLKENLVPDLTVPEGAQALGGGGGGGEYGMDVGAYFLSDLGMGDVYQHYFEQLELAGWRIVSEQETDNQMTSFWELSDKDGADWSGKMEVIFSPPDFEDTYLVNVAILFPH